jgi:uncharacterized membrane protein YkoI
MEFSMIRHAIFPALLVTAALAGGTAASAATVTGSTSGSPSVQMSATSAQDSLGKSQPAISPSRSQATMPYPARTVSFNSRVSPSDVVKFGSGDISLEKAVTTAQNDTHGPAFDALFQSTGQPHYMVWLTKDGRVYHAKIDAVSGKLLESTPGLALHRLNPSQRTDIAAVEHAKADLADAIAIAAKNTGEQPIAAHFSNSEGMRAYHVAIVKNGTLQMVWISPDNPMVVASR